MTADLTEARIRQIVREEIDKAARYAILGGQIDPATFEITPIEPKGDAS